MALWLYLLFFLSGASALTYEVVWVRGLGLAFGNTAQSASIVVSIFLGGLAAGALAGGFLARSINRPLLAYGLLEIGVGVSALVATHLIVELPEGIGSIAGSGGGLPEIVVSLSALASMLVPTSFMGASLPVLTLFWQKEKGQLPGNLSMLYAANTLGAVCGSLGSCFVGFSYFGLSATVNFAAGLSIGIGLLAAFAGSKRMVDTPLAQTESSPQTDVDWGQSPLPPYLLYMLAGLTGFCALGFEILWTRLLRAYTSSSSYAFALTVAAFLLGIALGSLLYERSWISGRRRLSDQFQLLGTALVWAAFLCGLSLLAIPAIPLLSKGISAIAQAFLMERAAQLVGHACVAIMLVALPSTAIGIAFPLLASVAALISPLAPRAVGIACAVNTLGSMAGALLSGLVLVPFMGSQAAFEAMVGLCLFASALVICSCKSAGLKKAVLAPLVAYIAFLALTPPHFIESNLARLVRGDVLMFGEDSSSSVLVTDHPGFRRLVVNGEPYSSTVLHGLRYMRLLGHLPLLMHENPKEVLAVCFGTGTTAGAAVIHKDVTGLDVVELSPTVLTAAPFFLKTNEGVLEREKTKATVADGRNFLLRNWKQYDVITFEPPPPYDAAVVNLYSKEFYELVRSRLKAGGIMCQWVPMALVPESLWKMMVASARSVFPEVSIWAPNNREALLLASIGPHRKSSSDLTLAIEKSPEVQRSLAEVGLADACAIASTFLIGGEPLDRYLGATPPVTDDRAQLEFFLPYVDNLVYPLDLEQVTGNKGDLSPIVAGKGDLELLSRYRKAMHLLRLSSKALAREGNVDRGARHAREAAELFPENPFFKFASEHPRAQM